MARLTFHPFAPAVLVLLLTAAPALAAPQERVSIDKGWRFTMGDPAGTGDRLRYDVRPALTRSTDGQAADTPAEAAGQVADAGEAVLKPWILPSANAFIADPTKRHVRPQGDPGSDVPYVRADFDDSQWTRVDLPHDWAITQPFIKDGPYGGMGRLPSWGIGWYRRDLSVPAGDKGRSIFLDVDGAMSYATVWLNGHLVGGWPYGYASWRLDLTPYVVPGGRNRLAIRLDNPPESSRWYPGGGLYRHVWLVRSDKVHVAHWGSTVTTPRVSAAEASVKVRLALDNETADAADLSVSTAIYPLDAAGRRATLPVATLPPQTSRVPARGSAAVEAEAVIASPRLWGPPPTQQPNLYLAVSTVTRRGRVVDRQETRFGIRDVRFDPARGVVVNGEHIELKGTNNHHDLGALGAAFNRRAAQRQLEMLRDMGSNALRMSHNPPAAELLDLADELGFLVMDEVFDAWERKKTPLDSHLIFPDWHEADLRSMLRRDRNHPSVILWSVGNEVGEQYTGEEGAKIGRELVDIVHQEDPTRPATTAMNYARADTPLPGVVDVISLNYQGAGVRSAPSQFPAFHAAFPDKVILSSESASALSSRGSFLFPVPGTISGPVRPGVGGDEESHQVSAYELFAADFGSSADRVFASNEQNPFQAGEFVWTGWDYLGEPTPYYTSRSSYSGIIDLAGFPKDRFYLYQAKWRPDLPMAHLLPHWTWPGREGQVTPVHVFSSGDEAELFVNGVSQGRKKKAPYEYRFRWDYVRYQPGELRVQTWRDGKPWASETVRTAGAPAVLALTADRSAITAGSDDLSFVSVRVSDNAGGLAPTASNRITFSVEGPGVIVATDNGDATDLQGFSSTSRNAFNGRALAIVRATAPGTIRVRATADGLAAATIAVSAGRARR